LFQYYLDIEKENSNWITSLLKSPNSLIQLIQIFDLFFRKKIEPSQKGMGSLFGDLKDIEEEESESKAKEINNKSKTDELLQNYNKKALLSRLDNVF
jgi:hypothetical protein